MESGSKRRNCPAFLKRGLPGQTEELPSGPPAWGYICAISFAENWGLRSGRLPWRENGRNSRWNFPSVLTFRSSGDKEENAMQSFKTVRFRKDIRIPAVPHFCYSRHQHRRPEAPGSVPGCAKKEKRSGNIYAGYHTECDAETGKV